MDDEDISEHCNADIQESINCGQEEENKYGEAAMGNVENLDNIEFVDGDEDEVCHANAAVGDDDPVEEGDGVGGVHEDEEDEGDVGD